MTVERTVFTRTLRQKSGLAEQRVWALLRSGRIDGHKFRRQHPIGRYVADLACDRLRLVIEIDGGVHDRDEVVTSDHLRQIELEALGWTVLRFTNTQVLSEPDSVVAAIRTHARLIAS
ncbi:MULTISPECIES: endonuclease domain-containing protein [unclassified Brevundimonas]|uniref:endonuclease domain-containing protein n=1 Tax=unclassified Brevundimonas TaxID=2622653 RepID=UPI0025BBEC6E|nr:MULTISPECIES: endonuclease domain-containing protein [unclassified Brevundimonas]